MDSISTIFVSPLQQLLKYGLQLVQDIEPNTFGFKPTTSDGIVINLNHPAFVMGHLCVYPEKIFTLLDQDISSVAAPAGFKELFLKGKECVHDPDCSIYPHKEIIVQSFENGYRSVIEVLPQIPDSGFFKANPYQDSLDRFPTAGAFVSYLLSGHMGVHLGQVSSWRRVMGYPPA
ncbi:MAG: hypothetical protein KDD62_11960 [Bdellovibrionales bacterium]|nr:hypothetical protein [Bdellovibrionales bacterium]